MKSKGSLVLVLLALLPVAALGADQPSEKVGVVTSTEPGKVARQETVQLTATVESVDAATREVVLKAADGSLRTVFAGDDVRNLDQIKAGDKVTVRYSVGLVLQLVKGGGELRTRVEKESGERAAKGEKPGASAVFWIEFIGQAHRGLKVPVTKPPPGG